VLFLCTAGASPDPTGSLDQTSKSSLFKLLTPIGSTASIGSRSPFQAKREKFFPVERNGLRHIGFDGAGTRIWGARALLRDRASKRLSRGYATWLRTLTLPRKVPGFRATPCPQKVGLEELSQRDGTDNSRTQWAQFKPSTLISGERFELYLSSAPRSQIAPNGTVRGVAGFARGGNGAGLSAQALTSSRLVLSGSSIAGHSIVDRAPGCERADSI
jgi:hypothetical protein